jgi:hypothetical protein
MRGGTSIKNIARRRLLPRAIKTCIIAVPAQMIYPQEQPTAGDTMTLRSSLATSARIRGRHGSSQLPEQEFRHRPVHLPKSRMRITDCIIAEIGGQVTLS